MSDDRDTLLMLGRIDGKLDGLIASVVKQGVRHDALETRVRSVEGKQYWFTGVVAAAAALIGYIVPRS